MIQNAVVIATDAAQFPAAMFLANRLRSLDPPPGTEIIVFSDSLPDLKVARSWGRTGCDLREFRSPVRFTASGHVTAATFYRLFLPRMAGVHRLLYLDVDTYPESDAIWHLFGIDMAGNAVAAVRDLEVTCMGSPNGRDELRRSGVWNNRYLNAGVMLIDAERYAAERIEKKALDCIAKGGVNDQTAINSVLAGAWTELSPAYNATPICYLSGIVKRFPPVISHFQGKAKPWHGPLFYLDHPARAEIERFIPTTPWPNFIREQVAARGWRPGMKVNYPGYAVPAAFLAAASAYMRDTKFAA